MEKEDQGQQILSLCRLYLFMIYIHFLKLENKKTHSFKTSKKLILKIIKKLLLYKEDPLFSGPS